MQNLNKFFDYIFLDLDGPVLDGIDRHYNCYKDIIEKYGGRILAKNLYWDFKRSLMKRDRILELSEFNGTYELFMQEWLLNIEKEKYLQYDRLKPKVLETLKEWKFLTENLFLVTMRQNRANLVNQLKTLQIYDYFNKIITCSPIKNETKYDVLKKLSFSKAIFIGDTEEDVNTAKKMGIKSIGITTGLRKKEFLKSDFYAAEISEIDFNTFS